MEELGETLTSDKLGPMAETNPVVIRRLMGGLRKAGIVKSEKGHGGGWALARPLADVTLADVYDALGKPALFNIGNRIESPGCVVELAVNRAIGKTLDDAEALVLEQLRAVTMADLAADVRRRNKKGTKHHA